MRCINCNEKLQYDELGNGLILCPNCDMDFFPITKLERLRSWRSNCEKMERVRKKVIKSLEWCEPV